MSKIQPQTPQIDNQHGHMRLTSFGALVIELTPKASNPNVLMLDVGCENRMEPLHAETQPGETVDMFISRLRGMMKALWQSEHRKGMVEERPKELTLPHKPVGIAQQMINKAKDAAKDMVKEVTK